MASSHGNLAHLLPPNYKRKVSEWLEEDCPSFDYGGFVVGEEIASARLLGKSAVGGGFLSSQMFERYAVNKYGDCFSTLLAFGLNFSFLFSVIFVFVARCLQKYHLFLLEVF